MRGIIAVEIAECQQLTSWFLLFSWLGSRICPLRCRGEPGHATEKASTARPAPKQRPWQLASAWWSSQNLALPRVLHRRVRDSTSYMALLGMTLFYTRTWQKVGTLGVFFQLLLHLWKLHFIMSRARNVNPSRSADTEALIWVWYAL